MLQSPGFNMPYFPIDAPQYVLPPSRPPTPTVHEAPPSPVGSLPPLIDESLLMEVEHCPKPPPGSARSTPSIDEGVGSYDGSSGSNSVPKTAECSACASPRDRIQPTENTIASSSANMKPGMIFFRCFRWVALSLCIMMPNSHTTTKSTR